MDHPGDSPDSHATRRRVWRFVFGSLFVVAVVGLWPLKGYRIDKRTFGIPIATPISVGMAMRDDREGKYRILLTAIPGETEREGWQNLGKAHDMAANFSVATELEEYDATVYNPKSDPENGFILVFRRNNVAVFVMVTNLPPDMTQQQIAVEILTSFVDGLEREIPGVTTFYNPPVRQLWFDQVRPFFSKRFPKWVPPRTPHYLPAIS